MNIEVLSDGKEDGVAVVVTEVEVDWSDHPCSVYGCGLTVEAARADLLAKVPRVGDAAAASPAGLPDGGR